MRRRLDDIGVVSCFELLTTIVSNNGVVELLIKLLILTAHSPLLPLQCIQNGRCLEKKPSWSSLPPILTLKQSVLVHTTRYPEHSGCHLSLDDRLHSPGPTRKSTKHLLDLREKGLQAERWSCDICRNVWCRAA